MNNENEIDNTHVSKRTRHTYHVNPFTPLSGGSDMEQNTFNYDNDIGNDNVNDENLKDHGVDKNDQTNNEQHIGEEEEVEPIVSILNVVVDYVMSEPTPFEPEEYKWSLLQKERINRRQNTTHTRNNGEWIDDDTTGHVGDGIEEDNDTVQVPIMRIFGPIVRGSGMESTSLDSSQHLFQNETTETSSSCGETMYQSGCLHIHGAYPYLLARPKKAGPDSSSFFFEDVNKNNHNQFDNDDDNIDWDDQESVQSIVEDIHVQLEAALRSSVENHHNFHNTDKNNNDKEQYNGNNMQVSNVDNSSPIRFIRKITVVRGRGFYTYCIGTAAPFLRIEYYNPSHRWRVKVMLERGLELPLCYHPQRTSSLDTKRFENDLDEKLLGFRCYEAHIPYTMQFFKDWNLAGMSWINVGDVRFRNPLQQSCKKRFVSQQDNPSNKQQVIEASFDHVLIKQNIPCCYQWPRKENRNDNEMSKTDESWTHKETSCDIEVDTIVSNILNVNDVMKKLPSQSDEDIHWRAVPSLREIWTEERERMKTLLPPEDNFLSDDNRQPSFTLSVKKGAPIPGSRSALEGSKRLFETSPSLQHDFHRSMNDIVEKYKSCFDVYDSRLYERKRKQESHIGDDFKIQTTHQNLTSILSQKDEALSALEALFNQFENDNGLMCNEDKFLIRNYPINTAHNDKYGKNELLQIPSRSVRFSQLQPVVQSLTQADHKAVQDGLTFCMEMEQWDSKHATKIDPNTLTPYDDADDIMEDEEDIHEEEFEHSMTVLATQNVEMTQEQLSQLDSMMDNWSNSQMKKTMDDDFAMGQDSISSSEDQMKSLTPNIQERDFISPPEQRAILSLFSSDSPALTIKSGDTLELKVRPPSKHVFEKSSQIRLHSIHYDSSVPPPWLKFSSYISIPTTIDKDFSFWRGSFFQSVTAPPSANQIRRWVARKRSLLSSQPTRKKKERDELEFDSNTRKILRVSNRRIRKVAFENDTLTSASKRCSIEEVSWAEGNRNSSQDTVFTPSSQEIKKTTISKAETKFSIPMNHSEAMITQITPFTRQSDTPVKSDPLQGIGQQGGRIYVEGGGLKASTKIKSRSRKKALSMMSIEIHVQCRIGKTGYMNSNEIAMKPDPTRDAICAVCYIYAIDPGDGEKIEIKERGCVLVPTENEINHLRHTSGSVTTSNYVSKIGNTMGISSQMKVEVVTSESQLLLRVASIVQWKDPDALISWDTQAGGLGYLINRGFALGKHSNENTKIVNEIDMVRLLGRNPKQRPRTKNDTDVNRLESEETKTHFVGSGLGADWDDRVGAGAGPSSIVGRVILNGWKIMSEEVKHPNASYLPAMVATVLKKRIPFHDDILLTKWYSVNKGSNRWRVLKHKIVQALCTVLLFDALDVIGRAGEAARLSGVEFSQSFPGIRGSQYKVEGVILRSLQSLVSDSRGDERNYFFFSPSKSDCSNQEALECQAMTLEPKSGFHFDPVIVCDFTALYPSLVIAYNLCYSTIIGKLEYHSTRKEMNRKGCTTHKLGPFDYNERQTAYVLKDLMTSLPANKDRSDSKNDQDYAYCMPSGSMFVSEDVIKGVLPSVLDEILSTRAMLKKASKIYRKKLQEPPSAVLRQLEARQLALKYVANVTYGYTSATFSGRSSMPLLADTIVESGRRTLSNAINLASKWGADKSNKYYGAEVVYGDTDSIFIKLPGRSVKEAFEFGNEFCDAVTSSNPPPVQLKLEKVYHGSLLQTKKKYCGMKFDSPDQKLPIFEAKGIETIRKDQCGLTQKILRNALVTVFRDKGVQKLQSYLFRQWALIHAGKLPVSDFILTGRVRTQYRGKVGPVQAALARRLAEADPGRSVQHKERLAYVIVASPGRNFKLRDCVLTPTELLTQWDSYTIHAAYYATKHVNAALQRCFSLAPWKINIHSWYDICPKPQKRIHHWPMTRISGSPMISTYFGSDHCAICGQKCKTDGGAKAVICPHCKQDKGAAIYLATQTLNSIQQQSNRLALECQRCNGCLESSGSFAIEKLSIQMKGNRKSTPKAALTKTNHGILEAPISSCTCIDCPVTYRRHEMRESEIEALSLCKALHAFDECKL